MNNQACLEVWNTYQSAWGPVAQAKRRELLAQSVADTIVYTDPASEVSGVEGLSARIIALARR